MATTQSGEDSGLLEALYVAAYEPQHSSQQQSSTADSEFDYMSRSDDDTEDLLSARGRMEALSDDDFMDDDYPGMSGDETDSDYMGASDDQIYDRFRSHTEEETDSDAPKHDQDDDDFGPLSAAELEQRFHRRGEELRYEISAVLVHLKHLCAQLAIDSDRARAGNHVSLRANPQRDHGATRYS